MRTRTNYRGRPSKGGIGAIGYLWEFVCDNKTLTLLGALFAVGVILGVAVIHTMDDVTLKIILNIVGEFVAARQSQSLAQTIISSVGRNLIFLVLIFFCGYCAISAPIICLVPAFHGLGYGITTGAILAHSGINALPFVTFLMLPGTLISALVLLAACDEALRMSRNFLLVIRPGLLQRGERLPTSAKYCAKFIFLLFALIGSAFVESCAFVFGYGFLGM